MKPLRDTTAFYISLLVLVILCVPVLLGVGIARKWNVALVPPYTFQYKTVEDATRFWPEPNAYEENKEIDAQIPGRNFASAGGLWYYWKYRSGDYCDPEPFDPVTEPWTLSCQVPEATAGTRAFVWCCYVVHQCVIWGIIYKAQSLQHKNDTNYHSHLKWYNVASLIVNCAAYLLHLLQTHVTYDAMAQDVTEASSQGSVILLLVMVLVMEYKHRGLLLGWPAWNDPATLGCPTCGAHQWSWRLPSKPVDLIRKYHGYAFAWATIYTTWYHPMESTAAHVTGFLHTGMILIQQSLIFTPMHLNKYWRLVVETWVVVHSAVVAGQTQGLDMVGQFMFGFLWMMAFTQIHGLPYYLAFVQVETDQRQGDGNDDSGHSPSGERGPPMSMLVDYMPFVPAQKWKRLLVRMVPVILYIVFVAVSYVTWLKGEDWLAIIRIPLILYLLVLFMAIVGWGMMFASEKICTCRKTHEDGEVKEKDADQEKKSINLEEEGDSASGEPTAPQDAAVDAEIGATGEPETTSTVVKQEDTSRAGVGSVGTGTVLVVLLVGYAIMIAVSVAVEAVHVEMDLLLLMVVLVVIFSVVALMVMIVMERDMRRIELGPPRLPPSHVEEAAEEKADDEPSKAVDASPVPI